MIQNTKLMQAELLFNKNLPEGRLESVLGYLETCLAANPFVAGGDFTVGDVAVCSYLLFCKVYLPHVRARSHCWTMASVNHIFCVNYRCRWHHKIYLCNPQRALHWNICMYNVCSGTLRPACPCLA